MAKENRPSNKENFSPKRSGKRGEKYGEYGKVYKNPRKGKKSPASLPKPGEKRLFVATPVELPFYLQIKRALSPLLKGKWVEGFNLHLTHLFIGNDKPEEWKIRLPKPEGEIATGKIGILGNRILYLEALHPQISQIYQKLIGEKGERINPQILNRPFRPHITLARLKTPPTPQLLRKIEELNSSLPSIKFPFQVYLYSSTLTPKGPIYKKEWEM
ncbi:MAG: RNA 2',3'-cyclic phosphodiesterase [Epsilonproteobacteria bacterium]|nr:RNA 2',3'-cyclic phosphodiesterase [Campylobacterota bacterium]NPA89543.1 RNA 2',3'-cyclic phosphodiesterase [Campylobacterota bacterium]